MKKVYILKNTKDISFEFVIGVYSTKEKAEQELKRLEASMPMHHPTFAEDEYLTIVGIVLDAPADYEVDTND